MSGVFPKYKLTDKQIRGIANIVLHEQGTVAGWYAEASQIANRTDIKGDKYATPENAVKTVTSGWYAHGKQRYEAGTTSEKVIKIVKKVFCEGYRVLPRFVDEHDFMGDLSSVKNGAVNVINDKSKWKQHKTIIKNKMGSTYYFYSFPGGYKTGVDPFGYTSKAYREKWGDFCYTVEQAQNGKSPYTGTLPSFPLLRSYYKNGDGIVRLKNYITQIKRTQKALNWALSGVKGYKPISVDGEYGNATEKAVKLFQTRYKFKDVNGKWGKLCNAQMKKIEK